MIKKLRSEVRFAAERERETVRNARPRRDGKGIRYHTPTRLSKSSPIVEARRMTEMNKTFAITAAVAIAGAVAASAEATNWTLTFTNVAPNMVVGINYNGGRSFSAGPAGSYNSVYAGRMQWNGPYGKTYSTYCTQLNEYISWGQTVTYTETEVENVPDAPGTPGPMGSIKASLLRDLYARHYATVKASSSNELNAAFQIAVWEITHENINAADASSAVAQLNLLNGAMQINGSNASLLATANSLLAGLGTGGFMSFDGLLGLTHASAQDQLLVVPIPVPALLAGVGLLGVAALRRRMK